MFVLFLGKYNDSEWCSMHVQRNQEGSTDLKILTMEVITGCRENTADTAFDFSVSWLEKKCNKT